MPIKVNIPNTGSVYFPDNMSEDDIHTAVDGIYSQGIEANPPKMPSAPNAISQEIENRRGGTLAGFPGAAPYVPDTAAAMAPGGIALGAAAAVVGAPLAGTAARLAGVAAKWGLGLGAGAEGLHLLYRDLKDAIEGKE